LPAALLLPDAFHAFRAFLSARGGAKSVRHLILLAVHESGAPQKASKSDRKAREKRKTRISGAFCFKPIGDLV
jgi:hypothetical protein